MATNGSLGRKLRMAIVGGGQGSFIGRVHVTAAVLDNRAALVAGALSSDPARAKASAADYDIAPSRAYGSYAEMFDTERKLPAGERIDFVSIATPNHMHFPVARAAVEAGFHVVCDKPMTLTLAEAEELAAIVKGSNVVFAVTHNYTGYPLVRQARQMILSGELGDIQAIRATYIQGWLRSRLESEGQKQAAWRTDPTKSGAAGCFGDIGTHAYNLGRYMTGLLPDSISCNLKVFEPPRPLDDYGHAVIRYGNGALGTLNSGYYLDKGYHSHLKIWGANGWIELNRHGSPIPFRYYSTTDATPEIKTFTPEGPSGYTPFVAACVRSALGLEAPPVSTSDSLRIISTVLTAYHAAETRQTQAVPKPSAP